MGNLIKIELTEEELCVIRTQLAERITTLEEMAEESTDFEIIKGLVAAIEPIMSVYRKLTHRLCI